MILNHKNITLCFLFFLLITLLIFYRGPCFLLEGTFQQDEYVFLKNSIEHGFFKGMIYVYSGAGYFNFWTNFSTSFASLFPETISKIVVTYFALSAKLLIFMYIYFNDSILFTKFWHKIFAIFVILFSPPMTPEVWMTTIHSNEYFGIFAFILLFSNFKKSHYFKKNLTIFLLFISGISSIYAAILTPAFIVKYMVDKSKINLSKLISIFSAFILQLYIVVNNYLLNVGHDQRFEIEFYKFISYVYNILVRSFFGSNIPKNLFVETNFYILKYFNTFVILLFIFITFYLMFYIFKKRDKVLYLTVFCLLIVSSFVMGGSLYSDFVGGRYAVVPGIIVIFLVFRIFTIEKIFPIKILASAMLISSLVVGLVEFKYKSPLPQLLNCSYFSLVK
tara:strand:+ start:62 stop:1234 length:1173 start_codon:yes stop_codon:yes gene_type:complete